LSERPERFNWIYFLIKSRGGSGCGLIPMLTPGVGLSVGATNFSREAVDQSVDVGPAASDEAVSKRFPEATAADALTANFFTAITLSIGFFVEFRG